MQACAEALGYYGTKCTEHLVRVRLSHVLALAGLREESLGHDLIVNALVAESTGSIDDRSLRVKVVAGLHEVHLVSLKANFELFLNRMLWTVWVHDFERLARSIPRSQGPHMHVEVVRQDLKGQPLGGRSLRGERPAPEEPWWRALVVGPPPSGGKFRRPRRVPRRRQSGTPAVASGYP
jgi:hypothetical protein